jgi:hypothetical protein
LKDVQSARIGREISRQMSFETARQRLELEMEYERRRPTAPRIIGAQRRNELDWARNYASSTEIWSGSTLNVLLRSILTVANPTEGPHIPLAPSTVRGLNLTDGTTRANLSLTKDEGRIEWTVTLEGEEYDTIRDRFSKTFRKATEYANAGKVPDRTMIRSLQDDLRLIDEKLNDQVRDLPPSRFIESRRLLNRLRDTISGLANPRLVKANTNDWRTNVTNVAELVRHCKQNGLRFGPAATSADHAAYTAAFFALRAYELAVVLGVPVPQQR